MTNTSRHQTFRFTLAHLLFAGLTLLVACAPALPPIDLERAARLRNEGLTFALKRDSTRAAERYTEATLYDPHNSRAYLDLGDFLESYQRPQDALDTYERALRHLPAENPDREQIRYQTALLLAAKLGNPDGAKDQLDRLKSPVLIFDLTGVIALHSGDPAAAIKQLNQALRFDMDREQYARTYFHIAQSYDRLDDEDRSRDALLIAVQKAASMALKEDIRRFFEAMLKRK